MSTAASRIRHNINVTPLIYVLIVLLIIFMMISLSAVYKRTRPPCPSVTFCEHGEASAAAATAAATHGTSVALT